MELDDEDLARSVLMNLFHTSGKAEQYPELWP
jgi:hypothetical protein